jgi:hypothetical protein
LLAKIPPLKKIFDIIAEKKITNPSHIVSAVRRYVAMCYANRYRVLIEHPTLQQATMARICPHQK